MKYKYLPFLERRGIEVRFIEGQVRIGPTDKLTDRIVDIARQHKAEITAELLSRGKMRIVSCQMCGRPITLTPAPDIPAERDTIFWYRLICRCGYDAYACERDLQLWDKSTNVRRNH